MSYAVLSWQNRALRVARNGWFRVDGSAGVDELVAAVASTPKSEAGVAEVPKIEEENKVYDLYMMSMCPNGILALGELAELIRAFPQREWNVWFVGTADGDKLLTPRGEEAIFDKTLWLGVKALYPFRYHEFLFLKASATTPTEQLLDEMDLDVRRIRHWADDMGTSELRQHYLRSMRLDINTSPTLLVNNNRRVKSIADGRLVRDECHAVSEKPTFCSDYPECFEDNDCVSTGKIGSCVKDTVTNLPVCKFRDDVSFGLTVLVADSAMSSPERVIIETVVEALPGARVKVVKLSSSEGGQVMAKYSPSTLPFFHFEDNVVNAHKYASISEMLVKIEGGGGFTLKKGIINENYFPLREEKRGLIELHVDPLKDYVGKIINIFLVNPDLAKRVALRPIATMDFEGYDEYDEARWHSILMSMDSWRSDEAMRWLVLADKYPKKYLPYLKFYGENPGSTFWFKWLKSLGINNKKFNRHLEASRPKFVAYCEDFAPVSSNVSIMLLINNRAKIVIEDEKELVWVLKSIMY
jgi:hypothetical protein